jgi:hypothetical protein
MEIKNRFTGEVLPTSKKETIKETLIEAVSKKADLSRANLSGVTITESQKESVLKSFGLKIIKTKNKL